MVISLEYQLDRRENKDFLFIFNSWANSFFFAPVSNNFLFENREKESSDHALMIRELQKLVTDERGGKEKLETELLSANRWLKKQ